MQLSAANKPSPATSLTGFIHPTRANPASRRPESRAISSRRPPLPCPHRAITDSHIDLQITYMYTQICIAHRRPVTGSVGKNRPATRNSLAVQSPETPPNLIAVADKNAANVEMELIAEPFLQAATRDSGITPPSDGPLNGYKSRSAGYPENPLTRSTPESTCLLAFLRLFSGDLVPFALIHSLIRDCLF